MTPVQSFFDTVLQMSSSAVTRLDPGPPSGTSYRLCLWLDDLLPVDRVTAAGLLGHSLSFMTFQVPDGFIEGIINYWAPERHVFRFGMEKLTPTLEEYSSFTVFSLEGPCARVSAGHMYRQFMSFERHISRLGMEELTPTLEEYARFTVFSLEGPCARVSAGHMCRQFMSLTGLRRSALLPVISSGHIIPLHFLLDRFSSSDSYAIFYEDFSVSEDRWRSLRVNVLMACILMDGFLVSPRWRGSFGCWGCYGSHIVTPTEVEYFGVAPSYFTHGS